MVYLKHHCDVHHLQHHQTELHGVEARPWSGMYFTPIKREMTQSRMIKLRTHPRKQSQMRMMMSRIMTEMKHRWTFTLRMIIIGGS